MSAIQNFIEKASMHLDDGLDDPVLVQAGAELERLRAIEAWVLEHAQHGARCPAAFVQVRPCTCGLAKIMDGMP